MLNYSNNHKNNNNNNNDNNDTKERKERKDNGNIKEKKNFFKAFKPPTYMPNNRSGDLYQISGSSLAFSIKKIEEVSKTL